MKVSVIIPTIGRASLRKTLESVRNQTHHPDEIIIEHDNSGNGAAKTRNNGARKAHGDILLFIDDDCVAAPTWVERILEVFKDESTATVAGSVIYSGDSFSISERAVENPQAIWFMGANCGARRDTFWKVGGFPEKYLVYEDKAFALACLTRGYIIARVPTASVMHEISIWDKRMVKKFANNLTWWIELKKDFDIYLDTINPPPFWGPILIPRDYLSFIKHLFRFWHSGSRLRVELLARQRWNLWKHAVRNKMFII